MMYFARFFNNPPDVAVEYVPDGCVGIERDLRDRGYAVCKPELYKLVMAYRLDVSSMIEPPTLCDWYKERVTILDTVILNDAQLKILVELAWALSGLYVYELASETGLNTNIIESELTALMVLGLVQMEADDTYELTPAGSRIVTEPLWASMDAQNA